MDTNDSNRVLELFLRLYKGEILNTDSIMEEYEISRKNFHKDMKCIRNTIKNIGDLNFSFGVTGKNYSIYRDDLPSQQYLYVVGKILLGSRALYEYEVKSILESIFNASSSNENIPYFLRNSIYEQLENYKSISYSRKKINRLYEIENIILSKKKMFLNIFIEYERKEFLIFPLEIFFDHYHFYLLAIHEGKEKIFKIDKIINYRSYTDSSNILPPPSLSEKKYQSTFFQVEDAVSEQTEFNLKIEWRFLIERLTDYFPNTKVKYRKDEAGLSIYECDLTVNYCRGLKMWLLMNSEYLKVIEPAWLVEELKLIYQESYRKYED